MKVGLVGFPGSGKTTVFNALTGLNADTGLGAARGKTNLGVVRVPDGRVDVLSRICQPKKTTFAEVTFSDVAGGGGQRGLDTATLAAMRDMDALCQVARAFANPALPEPAEPLRELRDLEAEMNLADLMIVEKRLERLKKEKGKPREAELLGRIHEQLAAERPLRTLALGEDEWALFAGFRFLSQKPLLLLLNLEEAALAAPPPPEVVAHTGQRELLLVPLSAKVEMEIAQLAPAEQVEFVAALGVGQPARDRFIRAAYSLLDLITFFTIGPDEVRAWTIRRGTGAQRAAGRVHSDIERGFIRAEVMAYDDFVTHGSEARCRALGKLRLEGKEYVVQDGEIAHFRFNI